MSVSEYRLIPEQHMRQFSLFPSTRRHKVKYCVNALQSESGRVVTVVCEDYVNVVVLDDIYQACKLIEVLSSGKVFSTVEVVRKTRQKTFKL